MTIQDLLTLHKQDPDKFALEISKMRPKPWKHDWNCGGECSWDEKHNECGPYRWRQCKKCGKSQDKFKITDKFPDAGSCPIPDPIPINSYDEAKKWQGECDEEDFRRVLREMYIDGGLFDTWGYMKWLEWGIEPHHLLIAACVCLVKGAE